MEMRKFSFDGNTNSTTSRLKKDPISQYNYVIQQYNDRANNKSGIILNEAYVDKLYRFWFDKLKSWWILVLLLYLAPYITFATLCLSLYVLVIHENALAEYKNNLKVVPDLLENMIFSPELCSAGGAHNVYFSIQPEGLESFSFSPVAKRELRKRQQDGKINFMVYDFEFLKWSEGLFKFRKLIWGHVFVNLALFLVMQLWVYAPYLCFDLLHPVDSISRCGEQAIRTFGI